MRRANNTGSSTVAEMTTTTNIATTATVSKSTISSRSMTQGIGKKIDFLTAGAQPYFNSILKQLGLANLQNAQILCEFITAEYNEQNVKFSTRLTHIKIICWFDKYLNYKVTV